jgi:hypothetical protein
MSERLTLVIEETAPGRYRASIGGEVLVDGRQTPVFDACRALIARGVDPQTWLVVQRKGYRRNFYRIRIGRGAELRVIENPRWAMYHSKRPFVVAGGSATGESGDGEP